MIQNVVEPLGDGDWLEKVSPQGWAGKSESPVPCSVPFPCAFLLLLHFQMPRGPVSYTPAAVHFLA